MINKKLNEIYKKRKHLQQQCKVAEKENDMRELYRLTKELFVLDREESKILNGFNKGGL